MRPALGACITAQLGSLHSRLNALLSLAKIRQIPQSIIDDLNRFSQDVRDAQDKRNRTIHDVWLEDIQSPEQMGRLKITSDKKLTFEIESIPLLELSNDLKCVERRVNQFAKIHSDIMSALPKLPEIPPSSLHPITENRTWQ
jgi:hypothetical protein